MFGQQLHVEIPVLLKPAFMGLGGESPNEPKTAFLVREDSDHPGAALDLLVEAFQHIGALKVLVMPEGEPIEGKRL